MIDIAKIKTGDKVVLRPQTVQELKPAINSEGYITIDIAIRSLISLSEIVEHIPKQVEFKVGDIVAPTLDTYNPHIKKGTPCHIVSLHAGMVWVSNGSSHALLNDCNIKSLNINGFLG